MRDILARISDPERIDARAVVAAIAALIVVRLVASAFVELGVDELYYVLWSRYPDWSYFDHPPMVAWWIAAGTAVFGDSPFGVRFVFVASAIPTTLAILGIAHALFGRTTALLAALWINVTLLVGVGGISATPDAPAVMAWALATWALVRVLTGGRAIWWLAVGVFAGLGVISKLTDLFFGLGVVLVVLARRGSRHWLLSPWPYAGGLLAFAVVAPMLAWNSDHGWVTFAYQFRRIGAEGFAPLRLPEMIATQWVLLNPVIGTFAGLAIVAWLRRSPAYPAARIGTLMWTIVPLAAYMAFHALRQQVPGNWPAPAYPALVAAAAAAAIVAPPRWTGWRTLAAPLGAVLSVVGLLLAANPAGILPDTFDPSRANRGWQGVAADAERLRVESGAAWIATTHYGSDAAIAYYLRGTGVPVVPVVQRARYAFAPPDAALLAGPALVVGRRETVAQIASCFASLTEVGPIERRGTNGARIEGLVAYLGSSIAPDAFEQGCDGG